MEEMSNVIENAVTEEIQRQIGPRNRAERRAEAKRNRKKSKQKKYFIDSIRDTATKLAYIDMIQKAREINKQLEQERENEENEH